MQTKTLTSLRYGNPLPRIISRDTYIAREKYLSDQFFAASKRYWKQGRRDRRMLADQFREFHLQNWLNAASMSNRQFQVYYRDYMRQCRIIRELRYLANNPMQQLALF